MKKEIMALLKQDKGKYYINNIAYLRRWTEDCFGNKVDKLELEFININHVCFSIYDREIKARDYEGIISECTTLTEKFLDEVKRTLISNLKAGSKNTSKGLCE